MAVFFTLQWNGTVFSNVTYLTKTARPSRLFNVPRFLQLPKQLVSVPVPLPRVPVTRAAVPPSLIYDHDYRHTYVLQVRLQGYGT